MGKTEEDIAGKEKSLKENALRKNMSSLRSMLTARFLTGMSIKSRLMHSTLRRRQITLTE